MIQRPEHVQFAQRISSDYILRPLPSDETSHYIDHRIITAGGVPEIFTSEAKKAIFSESNGIPRLINVISEKALVYGYATSSKVITSDIVESVVSDKRNYGI
jgi:type II secretory pathway predicted ATPase ExeA